MVRWFLDTTKPTGRLPFYCNAKHVGGFAVDPVRLAAGDEEAVFQLFITLSMYQALRDVVIMRRQRQLTLAAVKRVAAVREITRAIALNVSVRALLSDAS